MNTENRAKRQGPSGYVRVPLPDPPAPPIHTPTAPPELRELESIYLLHYRAWETARDALRRAADLPAALSGQFSPLLLSDVNQLAFTGQRLRQLLSDAYALWEAEGRSRP